MKYEVKKIPNCFKDAQSYEYRLPKTAEELLDVIGQLGEVRVNDKFRRPIFAVDTAAGTNVKGILKEPLIRVSFPEVRAAEAKADFEAWLEGCEI